MRHRFWLAERFATGKGCGEEAEQALPQDFEQAMHWCKVAAQAGHAASELLLGDLFHKAQGTEQNVSEAVTQAACLSRADVPIERRRAGEHVRGWPCIGGMLPRIHSQSLSNR